MRTITFTLYIILFTCATIYADFNMPTNVFRMQYYKDALKQAQISDKPVIFIITNEKNKDTLVMEQTLYAAEKLKDTGICIYICTQPVSVKENDPLSSKLKAFIADLGIAKLPVIIATRTNGETVISSIIATPNMKSYADSIDLFKAEIQKKMKKSGGTKIIVR